MAELEVEPKPNISVEENPVSNIIIEGDFEAFKPATIEFTERAEIPVISTEARVVEEITIGKEVKYVDVTVRDTVRKTEVDIREINRG